MYICLCHGITDKDLENALQQAQGRTKEALKNLKLGTDCGSCIEEALDKLHRDKQYGKELSKSSFDLAIGS